MCTVLSLTHPIARKTYTCMAAHWLVNGDIEPGWLTFAERRAIVKARRNRWQIQPGERYMKQVAIQCGEFGIFRAIPTIDNICQRLDLYEEEFC